MQPAELKVFLERENALAFAIVLASLAIALFIPAAAFIVAVLYAFLVPGWLLLKVLRIELALPARFAAVVLSSVLVSTQCVYWVSLAVGYSRASILASFATLSLLFFLVPSGELKRMARREAWSRAALRERARSLACEAKRDAAALTGALAVFIVFFAVLSASLWIVASDGSVIVGGWNYGDFFYHMGIMQSVNEGNFPPQEPSFAGAGIYYHWFSDLHTAFLAKATGLHPALFARFETALYCALLFLGVYSLALFFFRNKKWVKRAALLAAVLFVFGGSFAFTRISSDLSKAPLTELLKQSPYDNDWKFFQVPSLITGFLLVQRPLAIGLPVLALVLLLTVSGALGAGGGKSDKKKFFLAGLLCGFAAPFQFYAFAAAALGATLWFALRFLKERERKTAVCVDYAFFFVPCAVFAAPFVFAAFARAGGAGLARFAPFWLAPHGDALAFASFYAANLGPVFLIAIAALVVFLVKPKNRFEGLAFLALFALAMFAIPNVVSLSGTQWDMSKFFVFLLLACSIPAAALLARLPRALVLAAVLVCVVPGVFGLYWYGASDWRGLSASDVAAGEWVAANTPQLSVFLAAPIHNSAVESVGGRLRVTGYAALVSNYGLPYQEREADLRTAFCGSASDAARVARKYDARFVWLGGAERSTYAGCGFAFASSPLFERVYDSDGVSVFQLS